MRRIPKALYTTMVHTALLNLVHWNDLQCHVLVIKCEKVSCPLPPFYWGS